MLLKGLVTLFPGVCWKTGFRDDICVILAMTTNLPCPFRDIHLSIYLNIYFSFLRLVEGCVKPLLFMHNIFQKRSIRHSTAKEQKQKLYSLYVTILIFRLHWILKHRLPFLLIAQQYLILGVGKTSIWLSKSCLPKLFWISLCFHYKKSCIHKM